MQLVLLSHAVRLDPSLLLNSDTWSLASSIVRSCEPEFQLARMKLAQHVLMRVQDTRIGKSWLEKWYPALPEQARIRVRHSAERASHRAKYQALLRDAELSLAPLPTDAGAVIALEGGFLLMHRDESGRWRPLDRRVPIGRFELPVFLTWLRERNVRYVVVPLDFPEPGKQTVFLRHIRTTAPLAREAVRWVMYRLVSGEERIAPAMQVIPRNARVLVVSKGDEALVDVDGWDAWHFPRGEGGGYAGYYPADSAEAIAHLEGLRVQGAQYLVFPRTSFWWLDHYPEFRVHLEQRYPRLPVPGDACHVFSLTSREDDPRGAEIVARTGSGLL
jgi:hypothetical protein